MKPLNKTYSQHLAEVVDAIGRTSLPDDVAQAAKICLLDFLACCIGGSDSPVARQVLPALPALGGGGSKLMGRRETSSPCGAAFFNGIVTTAEELDDSHRYVTGYHPSATILPALLAALDGKPISGERFIKAMVCGYEISGRICRAIESDHRAKGFHSTATVGPFGAAAAACSAMGCNEATLTNALGIAGSASSGLFAFLEDGATGKHTHPGRAAADGLLAAVLAMQEMSGPQKILESKDGFLRAYCDSPDPDPIIRPLGDSYEISSTYHKVHSACGHAYPTIEAVFALKEELAGNPDALKALEARVYQAATGLGRREVASVTEARFSIPFLVGMVLVKGRITRQEWTAETLADKRIHDIAGRVTVVADDNLTAQFPDVRAAEIVAQLTDGRTYRKKIDAPFGMPENPVDWQDMAEKFRVCTSASKVEANQGKILDLINHLDQVPSMNEILDLF